MNLETCEEGDWIYLAQFRNKRRGAVHTTVDRWVEWMTDCLACEQEVTMYVR